MPNSTVARAAHSEAPPVSATTPPSVLFGVLVLRGTMRATADRVGAVADAVASVLRIVPVPQVLRPVVVPVIVLVEHIKTWGTRADMRLGHHHVHPTLLLPTTHREGDVVVASTISGRGQYASFRPAGDQPGDAPDLASGRDFVATLGADDRQPHLDAMHGENVAGGADIA